MTYILTANPRTDDRLGLGIGRSLILDLRSGRAFRKSFNPDLHKNSSSQLTLCPRIDMYHSSMQYYLLVT